MDELLVLIEPYCHLDVIKNKIVIYNEITNKFYEVSTKGITLVNDKNSSIIRLRRNQHTLSFCKVLKKLEKEQLIRVLTSELNSPKAFTLDRFLNIIENPYNNNLSAENRNKYFRQNIKSIIIYPDQDCSCKNSNEAYNLQVIHPICSKSTVSINQKTLEQVLSLIPYNNRTLFIVPSNNLQQILDTINTLYNIGVVKSNILVKTCLNKNIKLPDDYNKIKIEYLSKIYSKDMNLVNTTFLSTDLASFNKFKKISKKENINFYPLLTTKDKPYISCLWPSHRDLKIRKRTINQIEINNMINTNLFGLLYIYPDGSIRDSPNSHPISYFSDFNINQLVDKCLALDSSWTQTRSKKNTKCLDCTYRLYCPPISEYERWLNMEKICRK